MKLDFSKKIIGLAPMAGYTNSAFRLMCIKYGADLVYSEMVSARGIVEDQKFADGGKSLALAKFIDKERPIFVQIFGNEPEIMAEAAKIICDKYDPDGIDINMGCPARKVIANDYGSSLMKEPELAMCIVKSVKAVIGDRYLSVKTRLGWDNNEEILKFAPMMESAGSDLIAIHGRTKQEAFSGEADWEMIGRVKKLVNIPVFANGGIKSWLDIDKCLSKSDADGVLIGQGAIGRPWIFKEYKNRQTLNYDFSELSKIAYEHARMHNEFDDNYDELKKHLLSYFKGFPNCSELRRDIAYSKNFNEFSNVLEKYPVSKY